MKPPIFFEYELRADTLCIGERIKGGAFRPCVRTLPASTLRGALAAEFGDGEWVAAGVLDHFHEGILLRAPADASTGVSKIPLSTDVLEGVKGTVFIKATSCVGKLPLEFALTLGALKSQGLGRTKMKFRRKTPDAQTGEGKLRTRIPKSMWEDFLVRPLQPIYCYLFHPTGPADGYYELSLREGSFVKALAFLLEVEQNG